MLSGFFYYVIANTSALSTGSVKQSNEIPQYFGMTLRTFLNLEIPFSLLLEISFSRILYPVIFLFSLEFYIYSW